MRMNLTIIRQFRLFRHTAQNPRLFLFREGFIRWIGLIAVVALAIWLVYGPFFRISQVSCTKQAEANCDEEVLAELATHTGQSAFTLQSKPIKTKLEKANPAYQQVAVSVTLPNILTVTMIDSQVYTHLKSATDSATLVVDRNLLVVNKSVTPSPGIYTVISAKANQIGVGDQITDETLVKVFELGSLLKQFYIPFRDIIIKSPAEIVVSLTDGKIVLFTATQDITRQVTSLQLILQKATITKEPSVVDMRFNEPVLKY